MRSNEADRESARELSVLFYSEQTDNQSFEKGEVLYTRLRKQGFSGVRRREFEQTWVKKTALGDIYLPPLCRLIHNLRLELNQRPFNEFYEVAFPRLLPLNVAERFGLVKAWPHILFSVRPFKERGSICAVSDTSRSFVLDPVQCAPLYGWLAGKTLKESELPFCVLEHLGGWSYRNEKEESLRPGLKSMEFLRDEYIFIGTETQVRNTRAELLEALCLHLNDYDLQYRLVVGAGCFELEESELLSQLAQCGSINEIPVIDVELFAPEEENWLEVIGASLWSTRLTDAFGIKSQTNVLESGCVGVGMARLAYAIVNQAGMPA